MGGNYLPVCARCTGIYIGFSISALYLFFSKGYKGNKVFNLYQTVFMILCFLPFMIDGAGSYIGLWQSNNFLRIITGSIGGWAVVPFMVLVYNFSSKGENTVPIFKKDYHLIFICIFCVLIGITIYYGILDKLYFVFSVLISMGIVIYYSEICAVILKLIFSKTSDKIILSVSFIMGVSIIIFVSIITGG